MQLPTGSCPHGAVRVRCACGVLIGLPDRTLAFVADCSTQRWDEHVGVHLASQAGNFNALSLLLLMWASEWLANTHSRDKSQSTRKYINIFRAILCENTKQKIITKMHMWSLQRKSSMAQTFDYFSKMHWRLQPFTWETAVMFRNPTDRAAALLEPLSPSPQALNSSLKFHFLK